MAINLNQELRLPSLHRLNRDQFLTVFLILASAGTLLSAIIISLNLLLKLGKPLPPPAPGQLLNQRNIQKATSLIQEETIQFTPEDQTSVSSSSANLDF